MKNIIKPHGWVFLVLAGIVLLGAVLRVYSLGRDSLWYDEAYLLFEVQGAHPFSSLLDPTKGTEPPLFPALVKGWNAVIEAVTPFDRTSEAHDFLLRLLPCLMGILAIPLVFFLSVRMVDDDRAALGVAYLYAISPYHVYYAQELRNYTFCTVLWLLAALLYFRALRTNAAGSWTLFVACLAVSIYTHFFSAWVITMFGIHFLANVPAHRDKFARWVISQVALFLMILPTLILARMIMGYFDNIGFPWYPSPTPKTALITFKTFFAGYAPDVWAYRGLFLMAAFLLALGMVRLRRNWLALSFLGLMTVVPIAANVVMWSVKDFPLYEHRLFVFSGVTACFFVAYGVRVLSRVWLQLAALAVFTVFTVPCLQSHYANRLHPFPQHNLAIWDKIDLRGAARHINENSKDGDVIGHSGHYSWFSSNYYSPIEQHILGFGPRERDFMVTNFGHPDIVKHFRLEPVEVQALAHRGRRIWFVETFGRTFDYRPTVMLLREWLEAHCVKEDIRVFDGVVVTCYRSEVGRESAVLRNRLFDPGGPVLTGYFPLREESWVLNGFFSARETLVKYPPPVFSVGVSLTEIAGDRAMVAGRELALEWVEDVSGGDWLCAEGAPPCLAQVGNRIELGGRERTFLAADAREKRACLGNFSSRFPEYCDVVVENTSSGPLQLELSVLESVHTVDPMDLAPLKVEGSVWRREAEYCPGALQDLALTPSWVASMGAFPCDDDALQTRFPLEPGKYSVFMRCFQAPRQAPEGRGQAILVLGGSAFRATVSGVSDRSEAGWNWNRLGELDWAGGMAPLSISPTNADLYGTCYFNLGQVALVAQGRDRAQDSVVTERRVITLAPKERQTVLFGGAFKRAEHGRVEIIAQDPVSKETRRVVIYSTASDLRNEPRIANAP